MTTEKQTPSPQTNVAVTDQMLTAGLEAAPGVRLEHIKRILAAALAIPFPETKELELEDGRFDTWSLSDFAGQCRMQARDNLDPEYSAFMTALAARLRDVAKTQSPETNLAGSQPQHVLSVTQHPNVEGSNGEQRGTNLPSQHTDATVAGLEQQIKDLKHGLASAEGRAKNATSNSEYWRGQYDAISATPSPEPKTKSSPEVDVEGHPDLRETENQNDRVEKNTPHAGSIASYPSKSSPRAGEPSPQTREVGSTLSVWSGWDQSNLPWSQVKHQDAVCRAVFGPSWAMEDATALIGFIERTWPREPTGPQP